jgi:pimeloyl-ACP methyl ester carboxylesterase
MAQARDSCRGCRARDRCLFTVPWVEVSGLRIAFERAGEGPPLVLVHGAVSDRRVWQPQLDALANEFTIVAWDAPGCGQSEDPPESFRLPEYADVLGA